MLRLPILSADQISSWQLPLSNAGAARLLAALMTDDQEQSRLQLAELLADEPTLLLWSVCRSPLWQQRPPAGFPEVASWLARHGLHVLGADERNRPSADRCAVTELQRWAALAVESLEVSRLAAQAADGDAAPSVALLGLLHNAPRWLVAGKTEPVASDLQLAPTCLPSWLVAWLQDFASSAPRDPLAAVVARAAAQLRQAEDRPRERGARGQNQAPVAGEEPIQQVRQRWLGSPADFVRGAPLLLQKLARLRKLEARFAETLEEEKLEALKAFAYGASHEINNPLANISTRAQTLLREEQDPERRHKLRTINTQAFRAHELIADLMLFARPPALSLSTTDLVYLVDQVVAEMASEAERQKTQLVRLPAAAAVSVSADAGHLAAALRAVCVNSLEALRLGGRIEISVLAAAAAPLDSDGRAWAEIVVADSGPGIPPEVRRHLFDPYFSGREAGRGLGLGLTKAWRIVTEHGGRIDVDQPPQGAVLRIRLPISGPAAQ
jgi:signal transduction histidine kinase